MRVYLDTNVIFEAVLGQEEHLAAGDLIELAEKGVVELCVPVFVLYEITNKLRRLEAVHQNLVVTFRGHAQSLAAANPEMASEGIAAANQMLSSFLSDETAVADRWDSLHSRLEKCSDILELGMLAMEDAYKLQAETKLHLQDAIVVAVVLADAQTREPPKLLISRDGAWYRDEALQRRLKACDCEFIGHLGGAVQAIRKRLSLSDQT
jgi:predicted nucleic acid-binding protein